MYIAMPTGICHGIIGKIRLLAFGVDIAGKHDLAMQAQPIERMLYRPDPAEGCGQPDGALRM